ncbi:zinc metalloproteinase leucurolysin-B-like [Symsagittifera roscoffensis]|uniref:zinc metalloproteinase leucurolysin-B-like n=1 Tax=Symsagittifera roscoffensis TaxID=84072 RepID=UPI00307C772D
MFMIKVDNSSMLLPIRSTSRSGTEFQRGNLHSTRLKSSVTTCLYQGHVSKDKQTDVHSPVRIKYCDKEGQNVPELAGLVSLNGKVYTLHTNDHEEKSSRSRRNAQERSYVEIFLFHGFDWYEKFGPSEQDLLDKDIEIVHFADFYFAGLTNINLHLSLVGFHTFTTAESDPTGNETAGSVLRNFINYHSENLKEFPTHDNAVLLITRDFTKSSSFIGLTHVGTQCNMWGSVSWVKDKIRSTPHVAATLAHELGHNFGLNHNPTNNSDPCYCTNEDLCLLQTYISNLPPKKFSNCQQASLENFMEHDNSMCLHNEPTKHIEKGYCGDYIVNGEDGEECDCGNEATCDDPCCHASNCSLVTDAACSAMDLCCDPDTCQVRSSDFICREKGNDCDIAEQCNGKNAECPNNDYNRAGSECTADGAQGHC